jgi:alpha-beta hydrolase superfamily lysophospholipase
MRRLLLPLIFPLLFAATGCTQAIADRVLIPARVADRNEWLSEVRRQTGRRLGDRLKAVDYMGYGNTHIAALMILPERDPRGVIVVLHGLTDQKEGMLSIAEEFADAGYLAVVPDLRAHGSSGVRYTSMGYREKWDMQALLNYLESQGCDVSHTGVLGGSLGAAIALQWAGIDPRVKAVVAVAPFAELSSEMDFFYQVHHVSILQAFLIEAAAQREGRFDIADVSPLKAVMSIDTPILLAHGREDDIVPVTESRRLFRAARGPVAIEEVEAKHMNIREVLGKPFLERAIEWMDTYVPAAAHPRTPPPWLAQLPNRNLPATETVTALETTTVKQGG